MGAEGYIAATLRIASLDLQAARLLVSGGNRFAAFHCEQAAEKVILAVLTSEGIQRPINHQLDQMVDSIPRENPLWVVLSPLRELKAFATAYRYSTPAGRIPPAPTDQEMAELMARVQTALDESVRRFGVRLDSANAPAATGGPIR